MYDVEQAQQSFQVEIENLKSNNIELNESQQAILFAKILIKQNIYSSTSVEFCDDKEIFVSKSPTGYDVVGYYKNHSGIKTPFNITVCKVDELWYTSKKYVSADTKSCSGSILLWIILSIGCTLMGILMYYLMSAAIGI